MKYIKKFESHNELDLREMSEYVKCIKDFKDVFKKDEIYKIDGMWGDPESAFELGLNYTPIEFLSTISINGYEFGVNHKRFIVYDHPKFFDYFEIMDPELFVAAKKYNL